MALTDSETETSPRASVEEGGVERQEQAPGPVTDSNSCEGEAMCVVHAGDTREVREGRCSGRDSDFIWRIRWGWGGQHLVILSAESSLGPHPQGLLPWSPGSRPCGLRLRHRNFRTASHPATRPPTSGNA